MKMTAFAMAALAVVSAAQDPVAPAAADLELAVTRFLETADQYARTFQNLTVEETTVHEEFDGPMLAADWGFIIGWQKEFGLGSNSFFQDLWPF